jgi:hypothetical protein
MTSTTAFDLGKAAAVALTILSAVIAAAINSTDLGLTKQVAALLSIVQAGLTTALLFLPRPNERAIVSPTPVERVETPTARRMP